MAAENVEVYSYLFDMKWHVIAKHSNIIVVKKLLVDEKNNSLCEVCLQGVLCKAFNRKTLLGETFCFLENVSKSIFKRSAWSNSFYILFLRAADRLAHNQVSCNTIGQLCLSGPGFSIRTVILQH